MQKPLNFLKAILLLILIGLLHISISQAQPVIDLSKADSSMIIGKQILLFEDPSARMTFEQISSPSNEANFYKRSENIYNFGNTDAAIWGKLKIIVPQRTQWFLEVDNQSIEHVTFYFSNQANQFDSILSGVSVPISARETSRMTNIFPLTAVHDSVMTCFLKLVSRRPIQLPLFIHSRKAMETKILRSDLLHGFYFGFMFLMILYNLFIWFTVRDPAFLYYVFYVTFIALFVAMVTSSFEIFLKNHTFLFQYGGLLASGTGITAILFCIKFLHIRVASKLLYRILLVVICLFSVGAIVVLSGKLREGDDFNSLTSIVTMPVVLYGAYYVYRRGFKPAIYFIIGWSVLLLCVAFFVMTNMNWLPYTFFTGNSVLFGSAFEALMFSIALANKVNAYKREKEIAQAEMLTTELEKEKFKKMNSEVEMKALRSQMNPHFIFNSLHSINKYVMDNDKANASEFLSKFARLMRMILENSREQEVTLEKDLAALELYMQLEALRFQNRFTYRIEIDPEIDKENVLIPPLLLQPFVENSILHGLKGKENGKITIRIRKVGEMIRCVVEDNGMGREQSVKIEHEPGKKRESLGMKITQERLHIISELKKVKAEMKISDMKDSANQPGGVRVELLLPLDTAF